MTCTSNCQPKLHQTLYIIIILFFFHFQITFNLEKFLCNVISHVFTNILYPNILFIFDNACLKLFWDICRALQVNITCKRETPLVVPIALKICTWRFSNALIQNVKSAYLFDHPRHTSSKKLPTTQILWSKYFTGFSGKQSPNLASLF